MIPGSEIVITPDTPIALHERAELCGAISLQIKQPDHTLYNLCRFYIEF
jgi:hypothetical protein